MNIIIAIIILGVLIFVHEFGHFITAKMTKMPVSEFALGMGPKIFSYEGKNTTYSLRAIPVGGFVNIEGMEVDSDVEDGFNSKSTIARFVVLFAGVFMNFLLAYFLIFGNVMVSGKHVVDAAPVIGEVMKESHSVGVLLPNDKIISINDKKINEWKDISATVNAIDTGDTKVLDIEFERDGVQKNVKIDTLVEKDPKTGVNRYILGIMPIVKNVRIGIGEGIVQSVIITKDIFGNIFKGLIKMFTGKVKSDEISGPIGIITYVGQAAGEGVSMLVYLAALLSINLGILNLLPLPALDGCRILFVILEMIGIKVNKKFEERLHYVGMILLFAAIFFISIKDITRLIKK